jgi:hypothetical protein
MSAEAAAVVRSFRVGKRTCTITLPRVERGAVICVSSEWSPTMPHRLSAKEMRQYKAGRDQAVAELAGTIGGGAVLVVE